MKQVILLLCTITIAACSISLPQKETAPATWRLKPAVITADQTKDISLIVAKPWVASGLDTPHVMVASKAGKMNRVADANWADNYQTWVRNYFLEGLQSSGLFSSVTPNYKNRGQHWVLQIYVWEMFVEYADTDFQQQPVVRAKLAYSVVDQKGNKIISQRTIEEHIPVTENRALSIMQGFETALANCFNRVYQSLAAL